MIKTKSITFIKFLNSFSQLKKRLIGKSIVPYKSIKTTLKYFLMN